MLATRYILFKLNYRYYLYILFKKYTNICSKFELADQLANKLKNLTIIY